MKAASTATAQTMEKTNFHVPEAGACLAAFMVFTKR
jgi:hypothetical protein